MGEFDGMIDSMRRRGALPNEVLTELTRMGAGDPRAELDEYLRGHGAYNPGEPESAAERPNLNE